jgi:hypothetical protein
MKKAGAPRWLRERIFARLGRYRRPSKYFEAAVARSVAALDPFPKQLHTPGKSLRSMRFLRVGPPVDPICAPAVVENAPF